MAAANIRDRLLHIARSIAAIEGYWDGKTFQDFEASEPLRAATGRHLLIVPEAVRHIPQSDTGNHPQIPWRDIAGIGNSLRHGYGVIDPQRIWSAVKAGLADLKAAIDDISKHHSS